MALDARLQIEPGQCLYVAGLPEDVILDVHADPATSPDRADAVLVFVTKRADLGSVARPMLDAARRDALAWLVFPKGGKLETT